MTDTHLDNVPNTLRILLLQEEMQQEDEMQQEEKKCLAF
jgi:hypothetical protein